MMVTHVIDCKQEEAIKSLLVTTGKIEERIIALDKRINGSYQAFCDHIVQGKGWRMAVVGTVVAVVIQVVGFAFMYGNLYKTVVVNERIIQRDVVGKHLGV